MSYYGFAFSGYGMLFKEDVIIPFLKKKAQRNWKCDFSNVSDLDWCANFNLYQMGGMVLIARQYRNAQNTQTRRHFEDAVHTELQEFLEGSGIKSDPEYQGMMINFGENKMQYDS
jgi:hypothetical protein